MCKEVSIPKAVSTAATAMVIGSLSLNVMGFNTVNGRYCCNKEDTEPKFTALDRFQYRKR